MRKGATWIGSVLLVIAALFMSISGIQFLNTSLFSWTFSQPEYRSAVFQMLVMAGIFFGVLSIKGVKDITKYWIVAILYLAQTFLRSYFWATVASVLYVFILGMTGYFICRKVLRHADEDVEFHKYILFGMAFEILLVAGMSVFSVAYPSTLRYVLLGLGMVECIILRKELFSGIRRMFKPAGTLDESSLSLCGRIALTLCLTGISIIACRANQGLDYDSMWYGIQSEYVLVPTGSIYQSPDLMSIVFTYAKGYEIVSLPFAGLNTYSFLTALNLAFAVLTLLCVYNVCCELKVKKAGMIIVALLAMTPSIMGMAMTAKADNMTLYLTMIVVLYVVRWLQREKDNVFLATAFSALILTYTMKQTSILFSTIILVCIVVMMIIKKKRGTKKGTATMLLPFAALAVVLLRTIILSGIPFNSLIVSFLDKLGWHTKYPYYFPSTRVVGVGELLTDPALLWSRTKRLAEIFFCPLKPELETAMRTWWGSAISFVWLLSLLVPLIRIKRTIKRCREDSTFLCVTLLNYTLSAFSVASMLLLEYPDGNYFVVAQCVACIYSTFIVEKIGEVQKKAIVFGLACLVCVNYLVSCCVSSAWSVGLTMINLSNSGYYNDFESRYERWLLDNHLDDVYEYMHKNKYTAIVSFSNQDVVRFLPTAVDVIDNFMAWGGRHLENADAFYRYLSVANIEGLLANAKENIWSGYYSILLELAERGYLSCAYENDRYMLMDFATEAHEQDQAVIHFLEKRLGRYEGAYCLDDCTLITDVYSDGWAGPNAVIDVPGSAEGTITIQCYIPFDLPSDASISILLDGAEYETRSVQNGSFTMEIQTEPNTKHELAFVSSFEFVSPPDVRVLSFLITSLESR